MLVSEQHVYKITPAWKTKKKHVNYQSHMVDLEKLFKINIIKCEY